MSASWRRRLRRAALALVAALALAAAAAVVAPRLAGGPLGPLPGGRLAGPETACPQPEQGGFAFARGVRQIEIEVRPERPRSVTTWALVREGTLFVPADWLTPWKTWPHLALADPRMRLRVEGTVYPCCATRVEDPRTIAELRAGAGAKYDVDPQGAAARVQVWWFRVAPCPDRGGVGTRRGATVPSPPRTGRMAWSSMRS